MRLSFLLFGVPKYRTPKPRIMQRKFGHTKLFKMNPGIVECPTCKTSHDVRTICGACYEVERVKTNEIKVKEMGLHRVDRATI